jgi:uncharacterized protein YfaP (DUF2135 family)
MFGRGDPADLPAPPPREPGTMRVRLGFGDEADLDLYVTDSTLETIYYGNTPSRGGGELDADRRCDSPGPRIEVVTIPTVAPGRYRVGVEYARRCRGRRKPAAYVVEVEADGVAISQHGKIEVGHFENVVIEVDVGP